MLAAAKKIQLAYNIDEWLNKACSNRRIVLLPITREVAVASVRLPGPLHRDPADRILITEARAKGCPLLTEDHQILDYPHVMATKPNDLQGWLFNLHVSIG